MTDAELRGLADKFAPQKEAPKEAKNFNLNVRDLSLLLYSESLNLINHLLGLLACY